MFLEQDAQNATTCSRTLDELTNFMIEFEQTKEILFATINHLQTYSLELKIVLQSVKNCDKKIVRIKG
jgi:hypothetical protein